MEQENFDFYQEALKAFDAPIPKPKEEEPAPAPAAEMTEPAPQEKPKRKFSPWWIVGLCAILCLALVIGVGGDSKGGSRGENCVCGVLMEVTEDYFTLNAEGHNWYVELDGLEAPTRRPNDLLSSASWQYIWVFYNGEPEDTDQNSCTKKITAAFWKNDEALYSSQDEIEFDLDGDGQKESWSLRYSTALPNLFASSFAYRLSLTAEDDQGNILHSVFFEPPAAQSTVFSDAGGKLSLVLYQYGSYEKLDIRLEDGKLAVYRGEESLTLHEPALLPEDNPLITLPIEPTQGPEESYAILFRLNAQTGTTPTTGTKVLSVGDGRNLKRRLEDQDWTMMDDVIDRTVWSFVFFEGEQLSTYSFTQEGLLLNNGRQASIDTEMMIMLLELMSYEKPASQSYIAYLENGDIDRIIFYEDGTAALKVSGYPDNDSKLYPGRYATIGDYYLLALGEDLRQTVVLRMGDSSLHYMDSMSHQDMFQVTGSLGFHEQDKGGSLALAIRNSDGSYAEKGEPSILTVYEIQNLRRFMNQRNWKPVMGVVTEEVLCRLDVFDGTGSDVSNAASYYLLTGCRLYNPETEMVTTFDEEGHWKLLTEYLCWQNETYNADYAGENQDDHTLSLELSTEGTYKLTAELKHEDGGSYMLSNSGFYVRLGKSVVLLGWEDGPTYVHLDIREQTLVYDALRSTPDEAFSQSRELTLIDLQADRHSMINLEFSIQDEQTGNIIPYGRSYVMLPEDLAKDISLVLNSVQWVKLEQGVSGIWMGSFNFVDSKDPWFNVYSGMRLTRNGYEAKLTAKQWDTVCQVMSQSGGIVYSVATARVGDEVYQLNVSGDREFTLVHQLGQNRVDLICGYYSLLGNDLLLCYGEMGDVFILRKEEGGWCLLPGYNGIETIDIPDGTLFAESLPMPEVDAPA